MSTAKSKAARRRILRQRRGRSRNITAPRHPSGKIVQPAKGADHGTPEIAMKRAGFARQCLDVAIDYHRRRGVPDDQLPVMSPRLLDATADPLVMMMELKYVDVFARAEGEDFRETLRKFFGQSRRTTYSAPLLVDDVEAWERLRRAWKRLGGVVLGDGTFVQHGGVLPVVTNVCHHMDWPRWLVYGVQSGQDQAEMTGLICGLKLLARGSRKEAA